VTARQTDEWLTRERLLAMVLIAVSVVVAWLCWQLIKPFVPSITWALVLAVLAYPLHERIRRRIKWKSVAAGLSVVAVTLVIALPATLVVRQAGVEAATSMNAVRKLASADRWKLAIERFPRLAPLREWVEREVNIEKQVDEASTQVAKGVKNVLQRLVDIGIATLITLFLLFYFLRDEQRILGTLAKLVPLAPAEAELVRRDVRDAISAIVFGTLVVAVVQGALGGAMFWLLGLPAPILWGSIMAVLAILPLFGAALVWIPAALFLALDGDWGKAILLTAWGTIVVGLIDNLLLPLLVKNRLRVHTVLVFIAVLGGLFAFGATGAVLGPLILALALALVEIWRRRMAQGAIEEGVKTPPGRNPAPARRQTPATK
jgi:predicted PurR-regulated permease PerM